MSGRKGDPDERELVRIAERAGLRVRRSGNAHVLIYLPGLARPVTMSMGASKRARDTSKICAVFRHAGLL